jgi:hypothetical protein
MAVPHVAGVAALYLSLHKTASAQELKDALLATASLRKIHFPYTVLPGTPNRYVPVHDARSIVDDDSLCVYEASRTIPRLLTRGGSAARRLLHWPFPKPQDPLPRSPWQPVASFVRASAEAIGAAADEASAAAPGSVTLPPARR